MEHADFPRPMGVLTDLEWEQLREAQRAVCECGRRGCNAWPDCLRDFEPDQNSDADPGL